MAAKKQAIRFDMSTVVGLGGVTKSQMNKIGTPAKKAAARVVSEAETGRLGFWRMPAFWLSASRLTKLEKQAKALAERFENLVVVGIGGSSLGTRMLLNALGHRYHNELPNEKRGGMRVYLLENNDPDSFRALMGHLDLGKTVFNVISKSGATAETAGQFALVLDALRAAFPDTWQEHFVFTTDPEKGSLRPYAKQFGITCFDVPPDVGGRYSVMTAVGLLPALCAGLDVRGFLKGAAEMAERCTNSDWSTNPAFYCGAVQVVADREAGKKMVVMMPYADRLRDWTEWYAQLWAESVGKRLDESGTKEMGCGSTPIKALGAIDQHSQMQLYMEGPNDKLLVFLRIQAFENTVKFPAKTKLPEDLHYFSGHTMQELILAEQTASRFALRKMDRPSYQIELPAVSGHSLGQLCFWAMAKTAFAGYLYGINPFDQPGVELGKHYAYGLLAREGYDSFAKEIAKAKAPQEDEIL